MYKQRNYNKWVFYKDAKMKIIHRTNGPAIEWDNGEKAWYINGKLHREDGPAYENPNGPNAYYFRGVYYNVESNEQWLKFVKTFIIE